MAKKKDPNNFDFIGSTTTESFSSFLSRSVGVETLSAPDTMPLSITTELIEDKPLPSSVIIPKVHHSVQTVADLSPVLDQLTDPVSVRPQSLNEYSYQLLLDSPIFSGERVRIYLAKETYSPILVLHESLSKHGIKITFPRLFDYIVQQHIKDIDVLFKSLVKSNRKSVK